ncbi:MAG: VanZ family protein [Deltaproteobacteria bacterium]|nr:VanZ family protein [Deltaproteobacteria bacterium]
MVSAINQPGNKKKHTIQRISFWVLVAVYTLALPGAILVYDAIIKHFSSAMAGKIPIVFIIVMGIVYIISSLMLNKGVKALKMLVPCIIIVCILIYLEPNPNKHIHIPEYIIMSWILFEALSLDYLGKGILILIFICSGLLGLVDELLQGIHPERFYGLGDMAMNSAATFIGILALAGTRRFPTGDWTWIGCFNQFKKALAVTFFGALGAVLMCMYLFDVKTYLAFWDIYPYWLLGWNGLFIIAGLGVILVSGRLHKPVKFSNNRSQNSSEKAITARLWILCPLVILIVMHGLVVAIPITGVTFR